MGEKILIVEDEIAIANLIEINLNMVGYQTVKALDGADGYEFIQSEKFDLILLDVMLPGMDGFTIMKEIRHMGIPVIFLTAKSSVADKVGGSSCKVAWKRY